MAENKIPEILADLPEDWGYGQTVAPEGESVGLSEQHGYNYLMRKVNECARVLNQVVVEMGQLVPDDMVTAKGGGQLILPVALGDGPYIIEMTEEETEEYALKTDLSSLEEALRNAQVAVEKALQAASAEAQTAQSTANAAQAAADTAKETADTAKTAAESARSKAANLITYGTSDLTAGSSSLTTGTVYLVYK